MKMFIFRQRYLFFIKKYIDNDQNLNKEEKNIALDNVNYIIIQLFKVYEKNS